METCEREDTHWESWISPLGDLDASAKEFGAVERWRVFRSGAELLRTTLTWGSGEFSLRSCAGWCAVNHIVSVSQVGLFKRFRKAAGWLEHLLGQALCAAQPEEQTLPGLRLLACDASVLCGPGAKGTDWRLHTLCDVSSGRILALELTDQHGGEGFWRFDFGPGDLVLGDACYGTARGYRHVRSCGAQLIARVTPTNLRVEEEDGSRFDLAHWAALASEEADSVWKLLPGDGGFEPVRLVRVRTPKGTVVLVLTSLDQSQASDEQLAQIYRLRWQVELTFKRLKSLAHLDELPSRGPTAKTWILARLLFIALSQREAMRLDGCAGREEEASKDPTPEGGRVDAGGDTFTSGSGSCAYLC